MSKLNPIYPLLSGCYLLCSVINTAHAAQSLIKDPTQPAGAAAISHFGESQSAEVKWQLQAITYSEQSQSAIINGKTYQLGQWLNKQVKLQQIFSDSVILLIEQRPLKIQLRAAKIKTEAKGTLN